MLKPRYYFADDFRIFYKYFLSQPHTERTFHKGDYLWNPGQPYDRVQYYVSGASVHFSEHESGRRKIISFHGPGTLFPGYHTNDFRIEQSLTTVALSEIKVLEFTVPQFKAMFEENTTLSASDVFSSNIALNCGTVNSSTLISESATVVRDCSMRKSFV